MEPDFLQEAERYIRGELTVSEREAFEEKIKSDPELAKMMEDYRTAVFLIKAGGVQAMKRQMDNYSTYPSPKKSEKKFVTFRLWYAMAAAASIALVIVFTILIRGKKTDNEKLFITYFQAVPADRQIVRDSAKTDERTQAFLAYEQTHYIDALTRFENLLSTQRDNELLFYAGISALAGGQSSKAISYLKELADDKNSLYQIRTQWYLSLAYLKNNQLEKSKTMLATLVGQHTSYSQKAEQLLEELEE